MGFFNRIDEWDNFPEYLKTMFREAYHNSFAEENTYTRADVIDYLFDIARQKSLDDMNPKEKFNTGIWIWQFFSDIMFPIELYEKDWTSRLLKIEYILKRGYMAIYSLTSDSKPYIQHRLVDDGFEGYIIEVLQDYEVFFAFYYWFAGYEGKLKKMIRRSAKISVANVSYALNNPQSNILLEDIPEFSEFYFPGTDYWQEPFIWIYKEGYFCFSHLMGTGCLLYLNSLLKLKSEGNNSIELERMIRTAKEWCEEVYYEGYV